MAKKKELEENKTKKNVETKEKKVETKKKEEKDVKKKVNVKNDTKKIVKEENVKEEITKTETLTVENKKDNTKKKKIIKTIIYSLIGIIVLGAFIYSIIESNERNKYFNTVSFNEAEKLINDDELSIIYWASPNCGYCMQFTPVVKKVSYDKRITFNYLNTANLTDDEYASMLTYLGAYDESYSSKGVGTPSMFLVQNGKIINVSVGALSEEGLVTYLTTNGFIK